MPIDCIKGCFYMDKTRRSTLLASKELRLQTRLERLDEDIIIGFNDTLLVDLKKYMKNVNIVDVIISTLSEQKELIESVKGIIEVNVYEDFEYKLQKNELTIEYYKTLVKDNLLDFMVFFHKTMRQHIGEHISLDGFDNLIVSANETNNTMLYSKFSNDTKFIETQIIDLVSKREDISNMITSLIELNDNSLVFEKLVDTINYSLEKYIVELDGFSKVISSKFRSIVLKTFRQYIANSGTVYSQVLKRMLQLGVEYDEVSSYFKSYIKKNMMHLEKSDNEDEEDKRKRKVKTRSLEDIKKRKMLIWLDEGRKGYEDLK